MTRDQPLQKGEIFLSKRHLRRLFEGIRARPPARGRRNRRDFGKQIDDLKKVYEPSFVLSTEQYNSGEVARLVARHVLFEQYCPSDLEKIIERYE